MKENVAAPQKMYPQGLFNYFLWLMVNNYHGLTPRNFLKYYTWVAVLPKIHFFGLKLIHWWRVIFHAWDPVWYFPFWRLNIISSLLQMVFFWEWWQVSGSFIFACFIKVIFRNLWNYSWKWILFFNFLLSLYKTSTDIPHSVSSESTSITAANPDLSMEHKCKHENSPLLLYINFNKDYLLEK